YGADFVHEFAGGESAGGKLVLDHATLYWREVIPHSSRVLLRLHFDGDVSPAPDSRPVLHLEWGSESEIGVACIVFPELVDDATQSLLPVEDPRLQRLMADAGRAFPATRYRVVA
ncbi:MAG: hypothetical protein OXI10_00025, partial [Gammaproteobacteria bacterium]|nr:hypothetical protein [Gammaproteobacteria bacterium]